MTEYIEFGKIRLKPDDPLVPVLDDLTRRRKLNRTVVRILWRALIEDQPRPVRYNNLYVPIDPEANARIRHQIRTGQDMGFRIYTGDDDE